MPRSHAKVSVTVWTDPEYQALPVDAQWLYVHTLAHPRLSLVGVVDLRVRRWLRLAADLAAERIEAALVALEAAEMVVVDRDTEELMVRTFTRHDLSPARWNRNLTVGFWRAWEAVESPDLRSRVVVEAPEALWERIGHAAPAEAARFRRSLRLEPESEPRFEPQVAPRLEPTSPSPSTSHPVSQSPSTTTRVTSQSDSPPGDAAPVVAAVEPVRGEGDPYAPSPPSEQERAKKDALVAQVPWRRPMPQRLEVVQ